MGFLIAIRFLFLVILVDLMELFSLFVALHVADGKRVIFLCSHPTNSRAHILTILDQ